MVHLHLERCESTQLEAFKLLEAGEDAVLVSAESQSRGEGRRQRPWFTCDSSLSLSFNLEPNKELTLTSLELGALCARFVEERHKRKIFLKWPNDLYLPNGKKLGGILLQSRSKHWVAGIGINIFHEQEKIPNDLEDKLAVLFGQEPELHLKSEAFLLWDYIMKHRLSPNETIEAWSELCLHLNKTVSAVEDGSRIEGVFRGIGEKGEALIETQDKVERIYNASLFIDR